MGSLSQETVTLHSMDEISIFVKPDYSQQISLKRQNSDDDVPDDVDETLHKRPRSTVTNSVPCPVADFGCLTDIPYNNLQEHYLSKIHQESLLKAVELYVQQLHVVPKNNSTISNNEENDSEIIESVNLLAESVSCLHDDNVQIHNSMVRTHNNILEQQKQMEQLKSSIEESVQLVQATQLNNNILQTEIETVKQMMMDLVSQSSNDGTFIWKITNVAKNISDAVAERQTSIYSPPFYSSPTGYKMCMRLYFNGDGQARRTHLSLFYVIMRGDYDAVLEWPFAHKITFCLYDQTKSQRHIIDSFRADIKSNSFQRPRSNMNIASGIPKFCPLPIVQQDNNPYVRDDCMFIRCMVDFASTPKTMLSYVFSLNPGLPKTVQQTMIQAEIERRNSAGSEKSNSAGSEKSNSAGSEKTNSPDSSPKNDDSK